jgi:diguanylate cyclase (GGDEF)-like protein/PAS domain S-box-containing protein
MERKPDSQWPALRRPVLGVRCKARLSAQQGRVTWLGVAPSGAHNLIGQRRLDRIDLFRSVFDDGAIATATVDLDSRYIRMNPAFLQITGGSPVGVSRTSTVGQIRAADTATVENLVLRLAAAASSKRMTEQCVLGPEGQIIWLEVHMTVARDCYQRPRRLILQVHDITARRETERHLMTSAHQDSLTGLANRAVFKGLLEAAIGRSLSTDDGLAVLFIDLDGFKAINDTHGHLVGDALLEAVARRLSAQVRSPFVAARFGGDEFTILGERVDTDAVMQMGARIVASVARPFQIGALHLSMSASIGVSVSTLAGTDASEMLGQADCAMYAAKRRGGGCCELFNPELSYPWTPSLSRSEPLAGLEQAQR